MNGKLKIALRVVFLLVLIYALAAMLGMVQGFGVQFGKGKGRLYQRGRCRGNRPGWRYTGMVGELVQTQGVSMGIGTAGLM
jgi:hypothetical protein